MIKYVVTIKSNVKGKGISGVVVEIQAINFSQCIAKIEQKYNLSDFRVICVREKGARL